MKKTIKLSEFESKIIYNNYYFIIKQVIFRKVILFFNTNINFFNVIYALFLREIQTRFGSKKMGYFWAIAEPAAQIAVFTAVKLLFFGRSMPGIDYAVFLASGFLVYNLFKNILTKSMSAFSANKALFIYCQVKPIHAIIARILTELLIFIFVSMFFLFVGWYFHFDVSIKDLDILLLTIIWVTIFAFSLGLLFAIISTFYENFKKVVNLIFTPLFFISALFYTVEQLPSSAREIILYNPIVHFIELIHGSYLESLNTNYVDYIYIIYWTIIPLFIGLYFYTSSERKIVST